MAIPLVVALCKEIYNISNTQKSSGKSVSEPHYIVAINLLMIVQDTVFRPQLQNLQVDAEHLTWYSEKRLTQVRVMLMQACICAYT